MIIRRNIETVAGLALLLAASACGSDGGDSGNTGGTPSFAGSTGAGAGGAAGGISGGSGGIAGASMGNAAGSSGSAGVAGGTGGADGIAGMGGASGMGGGAGNGGASGAAGSAGSGGSAGFDACPASGPCNILPLGDSITDGFGTPGGYRMDLFQLALAASKELTFVGGSMNGPNEVDGQPFPRAHEGHSGWTIAQIDGIVPDPALNVNPHIILLHIGTNDMGNANGAPMRLTTLINQIVDDAPNALLVVAKIIPFPAQGGAVTTFNNAIPGIVQDAVDRGKHVIMVDQFTGFPDNELADGIHPNPAGYSRMADVWYDAIASYLH